jgi:hypothetical protein
MLLLVVRSLAVYGGTAAVALWLAHRFVAPIGRRMGLVLAVAPLLFTGRAMLTGAVYGPIDILYNAQPFGSHRQELRVLPDRSPLLGDLVYQQIPWRAAVRRAVAEGRLPLWNPDVLAGEPLLAMQQPAVLYPGTWIGMLLPLPQAWTFDMTLRLLIALAGAYLFLRDLWLGEAAALLGALAWAFSNWMVFYLGVPVMPAAAALPLLLLGVRRIVREPGLPSGAVAVAALVLLIAAGHPETVLHAGTAALLYFLFELARAPRGRRLRPILVAAAAAAFGAGLCAVLLFPFAAALSQTYEHALRTTWYAHQPRSVPWRTSLFRLVPHVLPSAVGIAGHGRQLDGFTEPSAYAGSLLFPLALAGLFSRCRSRWFFLGLGLLGLAVWTKTPAADAIARLPLFDIALNERLLLLTTFSLCVLAAHGADRLRDGEGAPAFLAGAVVAAVLISWLFFRFRGRIEDLGMPAAYLRERLLLELVPLGAGIALVAGLSRERRARAGLAALVAVFAASRTLEAGAYNPTLPARIFYPRLELLERIPRGEPWRTVALRREFIPNAAAVYGLEDVRGYEAMTLQALRETYPLWCTPLPVWFNRVDDATTPFLAFLNVRWFLAPPEVEAPSGWPVLAESDGMRLLENPGALPRAFVPRLVRAEPDPAKRLALMRSIGDFGERGIVDEGPGTGEWRENGQARVEIVRYAAQSIEIAVDARAETVVATSIPGWRGWQADLDGSPAWRIGYNHAFLAFRVPEGRHRLALRYFPDAVRLGLIVSGAFLAAAALLAFWRRRDFGQNPS